MLAWHQISRQAIQKELEGKKEDRISFKNFTIMFLFRMTILSEYGP